MSTLSLGKTIQDEMDARGWSAATLADELAVEEEIVQLMLADKHPLDADMADRLRIAFGVSADFFLRIAAPPVRTAHALITPWPLSKGLMTWCGMNTKEAGNDLLATTPEAITCAGCRNSMRTAHHNLSSWMPGLKP